MGQGRADIQFAVKEVSRGMSNPTIRDMRRLKRLARYLHYRPRVAILFGYAYQRRAKENYLLAIPLLRTENFHVVDLAQPSKDVSLHLKEYSLYRMFQIQDLLQLSILAK